MTKREFVEKHLTELLRKIDRADIDYLLYLKDWDNNEEFVSIRYKTGGQSVVCVTADSELAIIQDVIRKLM